VANLEEFRRETRAWLEDNCPPLMRRPVKSDKDQCWGGRDWVFESDDQRLWLERMAERGWTAPQWPAEYGGGGHPGAASARFPISKSDEYIPQIIDALQKNESNE